MGQDLEVLISHADMQAIEEHWKVVPVRMLLLAGDKERLVDTIDHSIRRHLVLVANHVQQGREPVGDMHHFIGVSWLDLARPTDDTRGAIVALISREIPTAPWSGGTTIARRVERRIPAVVTSKDHDCVLAQP